MASGFLWVRASISRATDMGFFDCAHRRRISITTDGIGIRGINTGQRSSDVCSLVETAFEWVDGS
jgi:hypothetical protein